MDSFAIPHCQRNAYAFTFNRGTCCHITRLFLTIIALSCVAVVAMGACQLYLPQWSMYVGASFLVIDAVLLVVTFFQKQQSFVGSSTAKFVNNETVYGTDDTADKFCEIMATKYLGRHTKYSHVIFASKTDTDNYTLFAYDSCLGGHTGIPKTIQDHWPVGSILVVYCALDVGAWKKLEGRATYYLCEFDPETSDLAKAKNMHSIALNPQEVAMLNEGNLPTLLKYAIFGSIFNI